MRLALNEALKAKGKTFPNPLVGAVVVKNAKVISRGCHKKCGGPHAEIEAFKSCRESLKGCTLYVTLEPCSSFGRTPPCTDAIINSGIRRVFVGMLDPNPKNNFQGIRILRKNNIRVQTGFLESPLRKINEAYIKYITKNLPFITVKVGQSLDGKIATKAYESKWITSKASRDYAHKLRNDFDAIMIGVNTLIRDNPELESPLKGKKLFKIIIDPRLQIPISSRILKQDNSRVILAAGLRVNQPKAEKLEKLGVSILRINSNPPGLDLKALLYRLAQMEIVNILVEGGGTLIGSLFDNCLVDKILFFMAPKIIGGKLAISSVMGEGISSLRKAVELNDVSVRKIGSDYLFEANVKN